METIEYRWDWDDHEFARWRVGWPAGPWDDEPDKVQFADPATGLACLVRRNVRLGNLCGYVGVPPGHPLYAVNYDEADLWADGVPEVNFAAPCAVEEDEEYAICHVPGPGEPEPLWWFGFDNGHGGQLVPGLEEVHQRVLATMQDRAFALPDDVYATVDDVKQQCARLAARLAAMR